MSITKRITLLIGILFLISAVFSQPSDLGQRLPLDDNILTGKLSNGLTYYILKNIEPANYAQLILAVKVGSLVENDDQLGLAHFTEHMAFNGTESFAGNTMIEYLDSIDMGLLGEANALTSLEFTLYFLPTRTNSSEQLDKAVSILSDWSTRLTFDEGQIEKERSIIQVEERSRRGFADRMSMQLYGSLFGGSRYAQRLPIGIAEIFMHCSPQNLKDYYHDWYRPDLQAVIAVGDFEPSHIEGLIKKHFDSIPKRENPRTVPDFPVPTHQETGFGIMRDREAVDTLISIYHKHTAKKVSTVMDFRQNLLYDLLASMLTNRFSEISQQVNPPFTIARANWLNMIKPVDVFNLVAFVDAQSIFSGFTALLTEVERCKQHGFYENELFIAKDTHLKELQRQFNEKGKLDSQSIAFTMTRHFTHDYPLLNIEYELDLVKRLVETITTVDMQEALKACLSEENRVVMLTIPEDTDIELPTKADIIAVFDTVLGNRE